MNRGIAVRGLSAVSIERRAAYARGRLLPNKRLSERVSALELFDLVLEERGHVVTAGTPITPSVAALPRTIEGYTEFTEESDDEGVHSSFQIVLSEETYDRVENAETRGLFTIVHEVGHVVLHQAPLRRMKRLPERDLVLARNERGHRAYQDSEWQANTFAAAFIMPAPELARMLTEERLTVDDVCRRFGTSYQAAELRIDKFLRDESNLVAAWYGAGGWKGSATR